MFFIVPIFLVLPTYSLKIRKTEFASLVELGAAHLD